MKKIIKLGLMLLAISFIAATALAYTFQLTDPAIQAQRKAANELARKEVMPTADGFEALDEAALTVLIAADPDVAEVFIAKTGETVIGYIVKATPRGFGGPVEVVTGISLEGTIQGVRIGNHQETPGLGTIAKTPAFYDQYLNMKTDQEIGVNKNMSTEYEVQAISGATITSKCVTTGVNSAIRVVATISGK